MSATFRGDSGIKKISEILKNSMFIKPPQQLQEKELQLEIFGKVPEEEIIPRAIVLAQAQAKGMPVIIFCKEPLAIQLKLPEVHVFTGDEAEELSELKFC